MGTTGADAGEGPAAPDEATASAATSEPASTLAQLERDLLRAPLVTEPVGARRWAYALPGMIAVSLFLLFHNVGVAAQLMQGGGLSDRVRQAVRKAGTRKYLRNIGSLQTWRMFAPNPHRRNVHTRVFMEDEHGEWWDLRHDVPRRRYYPYWFYDRFGKINRRLEDYSEFHKRYAAWVCRDWELNRLRGLGSGALGREVVMIRQWTRIPPPRQSIATGGYSVRRLRPRQEDEMRFRCADMPHGQVPNVLRVRYGLAPISRAEERRIFRDVRIGTWWTRQQRLARKREQEQEQELEDPLESPEAAEGGAAEGGEEGM